MRRDMLFRSQNIETLATSMKMCEWSININSEAFFDAFSISELFGTYIGHSDILGVSLSGN
jgi:hypothetical protein